MLAAGAGSHAGFPRILAPETAQVVYLIQQLNDYAAAAPARQIPLQEMNLRHLFQWAHAHSPYWRERLAHGAATGFGNPLQLLAGLPVLRRKDLQEHGEALSCVHALPAGSCVPAYSTGSTGQPIRCWKERAPFQLRFLAFAALTSQWHRLDRSKDMLRISARVKDGQQASWGAPDAWFAPTGPLHLAGAAGRDVHELYELVRRKRPAYITATASVAHALARHALEHDNAPARIDAFLSTGDTVTGAMRQDCRTAFGARVIDRYTCEEVGWLAQQCPKHEHLHVYSANVLIEIVDAQGQPCPVGVPGRVLVTALHSQAMPLIRYEIGDIAAWGPACDCGSHLPVIARIWGRDNQTVRTPDGSTRYIVLVAEEFMAIAPLRDMRLRYYRDPLARLEVACDTPLEPAQIRQLVCKVRDLLGFDCAVDVIEGRTIDWGATDKRLGFAVVDGPAPALPAAVPRA